MAFAQPGETSPPLTPGPAPYDPPPGYPPPTGFPPNDPYPPALYAPAEVPPTTPAEPATVVAAEAPPPAAETYRRYSIGATLATSLDTESGSDSFLTAPLVEGAYAVHRRVFLALELGFGWLVDNQGLGESSFRAANPQLSGTYHHRFGPWELRGSLGVTAPLAHVPLGPDGRLYRSIYNRALASWGMWNQWLWYADRMAVPASLRARHHFAGGHVVVAELEPALVIGTADDTSGTDFVGQLAIEAQLPIGSIFVLCPRLQAVLLPSSSIDRMQTAAVVRGVFVTRLGRFFASLLFNLDEPLSALGQYGGLHLGKEMDL